jgi:hypothetical protein
MNKVMFYSSTLPTGATGTTATLIQKADSIGLWVSAVASVFTSGVVKITLESSPKSGVSTRTSYFYDYVNATPKEAAVTISTGGFYEIPNAGGADIVRLNFDVALTQTINVHLTTPKITF